MRRRCRTSCGRGLLRSLLALALQLTLPALDGHLFVAQDLAHAALHGADGLVLARGLALLSTEMPEWLREAVTAVREEYALSANPDSWHIARKLLKSGSMGVRVAGQAIALATEQVPRNGALR